MPSFLYRTIQNIMFTDQQRHGSSRWATLVDMSAAGLLTKTPDSVFIGYAEGYPLYSSSDSGVLCAGGAGTGKLTSLIGENFTSCIDGQPVFYVDFKGEITACFLENSIRTHTPHYLINPCGFNGLPSMASNLLDFMGRNSTSLTTDAALVARMIITQSGGQNNTSTYFIGKARSCVAAILKWHVLKFGYVSLYHLYKIVCLIAQGAKSWAKIAGDMMAHRDPQISSFAHEAVFKQKSVKEEWGGIIGQVTDSLEFMNDPRLQETFSHKSDFSLSEIVGERPVIIGLIIPPEYARLWSSLMRIISGVLMLHKTRNPEAKRVLYLIDEARQMGSAEHLLDSFVIGRGMGLRAMAFYQSVSQISDAFGQDGVSSFMNSAGVRIFMGARDLETASLISKMLGNSTFDYAEELEQLAAKNRKRQSLKNIILHGGDLMTECFEAQYHGKAETHRQRMSRPLLSPDEVMQIPNDRMIIFVDGCPPILAEKRPYMLLQHCAGRFMPNPYHDTTGGQYIDIQGRYGRETRRIITEAVPISCTGLPQYKSSGQFRYVEGFRPYV